MYKGKYITVVMPSYMSSKKRVADVAKRVPDFVDKFIAIDDKSPDNTYEILKRIKKIDKVLQHKKNRGYGGAQKTLYKEALKYRTDYAVMIHDDGQYLPEEMGALIDNAIRNKSDIVLGSRVLGGKMKEGGVPAYKYWGNRFLTEFENVCFGTNISEYHTGFRVFSRRALEKLAWEKFTDGYYIDTEDLFDAVERGMKITEEPISVDYRMNVTAANPFSYGLDIVGISLKFAAHRMKKPFTGKNYFS